MSHIPNFSKIGFEAVPTPVTPAAGESWLTPEGITVKPSYGPDDLTGLSGLDAFPGIAPYLRGPYPAMYAAQPGYVAASSQHELACAPQPHVTSA